MKPLLLSSDDSVLFFFACAVAFTIGIIITRAVFSIPKMLKYQCAQLQLLMLQNELVAGDKSSYAKSEMDKIVSGAGLEYELRVHGESAKEAYPGITDRQASAIYRQKIRFNKNKLTNKTFRKNIEQILTQQPKEKPESDWPVY